MAKETENVITLLKSYEIRERDILALENFKSRDGFEVILNDDLEGMIVFFNQYPEEFGEILPIIADGNSNYICVFFKGEDKGKVCYLSHDEIDLTPKFKDIETLINQINQNPEAWDFEDLPYMDLDS